jgi:hypothetical protein
MKPGQAAPQLILRMNHTNLLYLLTRYNSFESSFAYCVLQT